MDTFVEVFVFVLLVAMLLGLFWGDMGRRLKRAADLERTIPLKARRKAREEEGF